jgi:CO/xanthine dehydrogenase FAD-binding subunit
VAPSIVEVTGLDLTGRSAEDAVASVADAARGAASPISDLRASDGYRLHTVGVMASRAVDAAIRRAGGDSIAVPVNRAEGIGASR